MEVAPGDAGATDNSSPGDADGTGPPAESSTRHTMLAIGRPIGIGAPGASHAPGSVDHTVVSVGPNSSIGPHTDEQPRRPARGTSARRRTAR